MLGPGAHALPPPRCARAGNLERLRVTVKDTDLIAIREENGGPTFAAITARSYHPGGVNVLFGDGSVRFLKDTVAGITSPTTRNHRRQ